MPIAEHRLGEPIREKRLDVHDDAIHLADRWVTAAGVQVHFSID